jgi:hypothetical protein
MRARAIASQHSRSGVFSKSFSIENNCGGGFPNKENRPSHRCSHLPKGVHGQNVLFYLSPERGTKNLGIFISRLENCGAKILRIAAE